MKLLVMTLIFLCGLAIGGWYADDVMTDEQAQKISNFFHLGIDFLD